ncbi:TIGR02391 family protein [Halopseudomonas pelagia]|uniref:Conserved hypothetical protein CHP02391 domain-containing protein n=1 Tax=Halopseudomonas pelagia TaxID=553151 RepID=A0AA91U6D1_9GAMM|nr:TIGR02391 family protein [Halopseudomonas pelagia]PCD01152.1 hypothetical protein CO192_01560 [Halopseudomonas pelagia]QFY57058.1 hypothetical protein EAO82_12215 [Halopseudomonas pelagia]
MQFERFAKEPLAIQYLGTEYTQPCLDALRSLIQLRVPISQVKLLTASEGQTNIHGFLISTELDELIAIRPGFSSGYPDEGSRGLATAIELLRTFRFEVEEYSVSGKLLARVKRAALTLQDLKFLESANPIMPIGLDDYVYDAGLFGRPPGVFLRGFEPCIPLALIDERLADLVVDFFEHSNARLMSGYARLEVIIKNRTGLNESAGKLFRAAFDGTSPYLMWPEIDQGERVGRVGLFVSVYQTYRNRRAHNEVVANEHLDLTELLLLNNLFVLERSAVPSGRLFPTIHDDPFK